MNAETIRNNSASIFSLWCWACSVMDYGNTMKVLHPLVMARHVAEENLKKE